MNEHNIKVNDIPRLIDVMDTTADGAITYEEWCAAIKPKRPIRGADPSGMLTLE